MGTLLDFARACRITVDDVVAGLNIDYDRMRAELHFDVHQFSSGTSSDTPGTRQSPSQNRPGGATDALAQTCLQEQLDRLTKENAALRVTLDALADEFKQLAAVVKTRTPQRNKPLTRGRR